MTTEKLRAIWRKASAKYRQSHPNALRNWQQRNRKLCASYTNAWRKRNPEKIKAQELRRSTLNREAYLAWRRAVNLRNRDKRRAYNLSNSEKSRTYHKRFYREHRERYDRYSQNRRANQIVKPEHIKAVETIYARARVLRRWFNVCVDHIIQLCKGGRHVPSHLQLIYQSANLLKARRLDYKAKVVFS